MPINWFHTTLTLHWSLVLRLSLHLVILVNILLMVVTVWHFHVMLVHSVVMKFLLFVFMNMFLNILPLLLHSLNVGKFSKICERRW